MKRLIVSMNHESTHVAAKQAIFDILTYNLSKIFPIGKEIKEAIRIVIDDHYNGKAVGGETICFTAKVDPKQQFIFPAMTRFVSRNSVNP